VSELLVHHDDERIRLVSSAGVLLVHVRVRMTHAELVEIHAAQEYLRATAGHHAVFVIVGDIRAEMSERARSFSRRTAAEFADAVVCVAHVVEARGFVGAAVRCVMAGMRAVNRPPYPVREFATTRGAALWMAPLLKEAEIELGFEASPGGLLDWIDRARAPELFDSGQISLS
jgi:hypothetical protein